MRDRLACLCISVPPGGGHWELCPVGKLEAEFAAIKARVEKAREAWAEWHPVVAGRFASEPYDRATAYGRLREFLEGRP